MARSLEAAEAAGHKLVILIGDEPYYGKFGFARVKPGRLTLPGPVDPARLLYRELVPGAFENASGKVTAGRWSAVAGGLPALDPRPSTTQASTELPSRAKRPMKPIASGSTPTPRTTLLSVRLMPDEVAAAVARRLVHGHEPRHRDVGARARADAADRCRRSPRRAAAACRCVDTTSWNSRGFSGPTLSSTDSVPSVRR